VSAQHAHARAERKITPGDFNCSTSNANGTVSFLVCGVSAVAYKPASAAAFLGAEVEAASPFCCDAGMWLAHLIGILLWL
jgi:hypothetical protein